MVNNFSIVFPRFNRGCLFFYADFPFESNEKTGRRHFVTSIFRLFFFATTTATPLVYALLSTSRAKKEAALRKWFDREEVKFHLSFLSVFKLSFSAIGRKEMEWERRDRMVLSTIDLGYWNSKPRNRIRYIERLFPPLFRLLFPRCPSDYSRNEF